MPNAKACGPKRRSRRPRLFILSLFQLCLHRGDSCLKCSQVSTDLVLFLIGLEFILNLCRTAVCCPSSVASARSFQAQHRESFFSKLFSYVLSFDCSWRRYLYFGELAGRVPPDLQTVRALRARHEQLPPRSLATTGSVL